MSLSTSKGVDGEDRGHGVGLTRIGGKGQYAASAMRPAGAGAHAGNAFIATRSVTIRNSAWLW